MSWDIFVLDLPEGIKRLEDIPADFQPRALGHRSEIMEKIQRAIPGADFSDPSWGRINLPGCSVEVNLGHEEEVGTVALHVRGGETAPGVVAAIIDALGFKALDAAAANGLFDREAAQESYVKWQRYRDQINS